MTRIFATAAATVLLTVAGDTGTGHAQTSAPQGTAAAGVPAAPARCEAPANLPNYRIGVGDVLFLTFWREPDLSGEVVVRPDGKITIPLLKDVVAAGLMPCELQTELENAAKHFVQEPNVTVIVRLINSRQVFIVGNVARPGAYALAGPPITVLQFLAQAGGLLEFAKGSDILILRTENGKSTTLMFNWNDITSRRNLGQNIELRPGDTVIVP